MYCFKNFYLLVFCFVLTTTSVAAEPRCEAPGSWFPKTPQVPLDFELPNGTECDFYKWGFQTFLWLTQTEENNNTPRFLKFKTPDEIFGQSTPGYAHINTNKSKDILRLAPRIATQRAVRSANEILQAGSQGLLIDQNGRAVYYATHINSVFEKFVHDNQFTDMNKLFKAPATLEFPPGTLELKTAWKIIGRGDDASRFFTTKAELPLIIKNAEGKIVTDPTKTIIETVGLVGFHVVGTIKGHPEFIWATFEHVDNSPDKDETTLPVEPVSSRDWTFYPRHTLMKNCNKNPAGSINIQPNTQQLLPITPLFRHFAFGGEDDPTEIKDLNRSVQRQLPQELAVWKNYFLIGAVWIDKPAQDFQENMEYPNLDPNMPQATKLAGEKKLSNSTMETYTQPTQQHCFRCHDTREERKQIGDKEFIFPPKRINVSHVLLNAWFLEQEKSKQ